MLRTRFLLIAALLVAPAALVPATVARAQLEEAQTQYEEASFEAALEALERAWQGDDLDQDDLIAVLRLRALVHLGLGDLDAVREDVRLLLSLQPDLQLDESLPPEVHAAAEDLRAEVGQGIRVRSIVEPTDTGVWIDAEVEGAPAELLRGVRVSGRAGEEAWRSTQEPPLEVTVPGGGTVTYHAEALGPGGAVIAREGSAENPLLWSATGEASTPEEADGGSSGAWLWAGVGAGAAAVVGAVVAIVLLGGSSENDHTRPSLPSIAALAIP